MFLAYVNGEKVASAFVDESLRQLKGHLELRNYDLQENNHKFCEIGYKADEFFPFRKYLDGYISNLQVFDLVFFFLFQLI